jgi:hypothetical protein
METEESACPRIQPGSDTVNSFPGSAETPISSKDKMYEEASEEGMKLKDKSSESMETFTTITSMPGKTPATVIKPSPDFPDK